MNSSEVSHEQSEEIPPQVEAPNADIDEKEIFASQALLYIFDRESNVWVDRANGQIKILQNSNDIYRILMRQNRTYVVRANHQIPYLGSLHELNGSNREFSWTAFDFSDTTEADTRQLFAIRFQLPETASKFKEAFLAGQEANKKLMVAE